MIYITHRLDELFAISNRVTVLRAGRFIRTLETDAVDRSELIALTEGRDLSGIIERNQFSQELVLELASGIHKEIP